MADLEKNIVGAFILNAKLFDEIDCKPILFESPYCRLILKQLKAAHKDRRKMDIVILSEDLDRKVPVSYITSLLDGFPRSEATPEVVNEKLRRLKNKRIGGLIIQEAQKRGEDILKGVPTDIGKIRSLFTEFDSINENNTPVLKLLDDIAPRNVDWLWWNRIPKGSLTLFVGDPGEGKSILCEYLAARLSKGERLPDKADFKKTGSTIFLTAEDNLADTVRVRADDAGADCKKIHVLDGLINDEIFLLSKHLTFLEKEIQRISDVLLLVLDPITAFGVPIMSSSKDEGKTVRARLTPLVKLAEKYNISVVAVSHCNKDQAKKAVYRVLGSIDFIAAARTVWLVQSDENDESHNRRFFSPLKYNLCKNPETLAFSIDGPLGHPKITFEKDPVDMSAGELLADKEEKENWSREREAQIFLKETLKNSEALTSKEIYKLADIEGISVATLKRAKRKMKIHVFQENRQWQWRLE